METTTDKDTQYIIDDLTAACNSLGKIDENDGTYMRDRDCKPCLRELLRFLNVNDNNHTARCLLGSINVIKSDMIPLIVQYCDFTDGDSDLFSLILRICTNLTTSLHILFNERELPVDQDDIKQREMVKGKLLKGLYGFKEAFASDEKIWSTLNVHLRGNVDEEVVFERLIILIRNILHIPVDSTFDLGVHSEFDVHDMCLHRMDKSGILNTLIYLMSDTQRGAEYCFHITEIVYLMLRDQNPETLASARANSFKRKLCDDDVDKKRYQELRERNRREQLRLGRNVTSTRHATFAIQNYRSLGEKPLMTRKIVNERQEVTFDGPKTELRKAKNQRPLDSETFMMISDKNLKISKISYGLKVFCKKFVEKIFNNYMQQIKHNLIQKRAQENDESYYLWALQFFSAFARHSLLHLDHISEILSTSTLHFIQTLITSYQDQIKLEKKKFPDLSKRLHLAVRAYREVLLLLKTAEESSDFTKTVETIKKNIFTELEYTTLLLNLFQQYDAPKHSHHYICDLIQTNDLFLNLLKNYSKSSKPLGEDSTGESKDDFATSVFISRYSHPHVIQLHLITLKNFEYNDDETNKAILSLFKRIVYDCKNQVVLFQTSVFRCLLKIMESKLPYRAEFTELAKHLFYEFGRMANKRRWMYQELLFWKGSSDVIEIENAIDPPAVAPVDNEDDIPAPSGTLDSENEQEGEEHETGEVVDHDKNNDGDEGRLQLLAELLASSDSEDSDANEEEKEGQQQPQPQYSHSETSSSPLPSICPSPQMHTPAERNVSDLPPTSLSSPTASRSPSLSPLPSPDLD